MWLWYRSNASCLAFTLEGSQLMPKKFTAMHIFHERNLLIGKRGKYRWNRNNNCWKFEATCFIIMHIFVNESVHIHAFSPPIIIFFIILISKQRAIASINGCILLPNAKKCQRKKLINVFCWLSEFNFLSHAKISKSPVAFSYHSKHFQLLPDSAEINFLKILISRMTALMVGSDW